MITTNTLPAASGKGRLITLWTLSGLVALRLYSSAPESWQAPPKWSNYLTRWVSAVVPISDRSPGGGRRASDC